MVAMCSSAELVGNKDVSLSMI